MCWNKQGVGLLHPRYMCSFCMCRSQKCKKTVMTWLTFCAFHKMLVTLTPWVDLSKLCAPSKYLMANLHSISQQPQTALKFVTFAKSAKKSFSTYSLKHLLFNSTWCQFHQHFTFDFFIQKCFSLLQFGFEISWCKNIGIIKCCF